MGVLRAARDQINKGMLQEMKTSGILIAPQCAFGPFVFMSKPSTMPTIPMVLGSVALNTVAANSLGLQTPGKATVARPPNLKGSTTIERVYGPYIYIYMHIMFGLQQDMVYVRNFIFHLVLKEEVHVITVRLRSQGRDHHCSVHRPSGQRQSACFLRLAAHLPEESGVPIIQGPEPGANPKGPSTQI